GVCRGLIGDPVSEQRVGQDEELSGDSDEGDFGGFTACLERCVEAFHGRAVTDGGNGRLIERDADFAATAADVADAGGGSAVVSEGSEANKGGDGSSSPLSKFGQVNQEGAGNLGTDADDGLKDFVFGFEGFGIGDDAVHALVEVVDLSLEKDDVLVDV